MDKLRFDDKNSDQYEPTDSEEEYSDEEKELLENVRKGKRREQDTTKEIMAFDDSDDEDDDNDDIGELMRDSDIEGAEDDDDDMPDSKDWGSNVRNYYNTDFVDPDFDAYNEQEEEMAKAEEEEAKAIQIRLLKKMREEDFLTPLVPSVIKEDEDEDEEEGGIIKIKADYSGLSRREQLLLLQQDAPELLALTGNFQRHLTEINTLFTPVLDYVTEHKIPSSPVFEYVRLYKEIALSYCSNIAFYLVLKSKRVPIRNHPISNRLVQLTNLLTELKDRLENTIKPQLETMLQRIVDGEEIVSKLVSSTAKPKKLSILKKYEQEGKLNKQKQKNVVDANEDSGSSEELGDGEEEEDEEQAVDGRRGINYQISKNKGLTPHRKKELRNPRVKHRGKFRKALIRRKGAVRTVRKETKRYGGEVSGIKASVIKSIKFKS